MPSVAWPVVPGRSYDIWRSNDLSERWTRITETPINAESGDDILKYIDLSASGARNFYRVKWVE